jgi:hypothetical protein
VKKPCGAGSVKTKSFRIREWATNMAPSAMRSRKMA